MSFDSNGYLASGIHDYSIEEINEKFVISFPTSTTRKDIFSGYLKHCEEIRGLDVECTEFLDGSFVTNKADPGDVDLVGFIDLDAVDALSEADQTKLTLLFSGKDTKRSHSCDAYFVATVPQDHPLFNDFRTARKYWMGEFGFDRQDRPKGIVRTVVAAPECSGEDDA